MRLIDADALIDDLKHDVAVDQDSLDYEELTDSNRENIQFDKDCKQNAIDLLQHAPTIEPKQRWVPVTERLPESDPDELEYPTVLGSFADGSIQLVCYYESTKEWGGGENFDMKRYPIAWMPLPEPYKGET